MTEQQYKSINKLCLTSDKKLNYERLIIALENENVTIDEYMSVLKTHKKMLAVYGNCQAAYVLQMLSKTDILQGDFVFLNFRGVHVMKGAGYDLSKLIKCFKYLDVFIYQYVKMDTQFGEEFATDNIIKVLTPSCKKVCIPNIFFKGYYPHYVHDKESVFFDEEKNFYWEPIDGELNELFKKNYSVSECIKILESKNYFSKEDCEENVKKSLTELIKREEKCDVRISDYIEVYYTQKLLFYTPNHPTNIVQKELVCRVLRRLGYKNFKIDMKDIPENDHVELFIYPSIRENLGLEFQKNKFRVYKYFDLQYDDLKSYIEKYKLLLNNASYYMKNMESAILYNEKYVSKRGLSVMEYKNGWCHLTCYLNVNFKDKINDTIFWLPLLFAPQTPFMTTIMPIDMKSGACTFANNGEVKLNIDNRDGKVKTFIIDTCYIPRINI